MNTTSPFSCALHRINQPFYKSETFFSRPKVFPMVLKFDNTKKSRRDRFEQQRKSRPFYMKKETASAKETNNSRVVHGF